MIPLNQKVTVHLTNEGIDEWGIPVKSTSLKTYKVRLDFNSQALIVYTGGDGREVVYGAIIYFKGAVPIRYTDYIEYDSGIDGVVQANPKMISPISDLSGHVTYTKVYV